MFRKDRVVEIKGVNHEEGVKYKGGGVLLYIKNSFNVVRRYDFDDEPFLKVFGVILKLGVTKRWLVYATGQVITIGYKMTRLIFFLVGLVKKNY